MKCCFGRAMSIGALIVGMTVGVPSAAQDEQEAVEKVPPAAPEPSRQEEAEARAQIEEWVRQLGHDKYRVREAAAEKLSQAGAAARPALERAADDDDPEVRWRVARLLDGLGAEQRQQPRGLRRLRGAPPEDDEAEPGLPLHQFESAQDMTRRIEELMRQFGGLEDPDLRGFIEGRPFEFRLFDDQFGVLDEMLERQGLGQAGGMGPGSSWSQTRIENGVRRDLRVQVGADGQVRVEETTGGDTRTVEAESMEALREKDPALHDRIQAPRIDFGLRGLRRPGLVPRGSGRLLPELPLPPTSPRSLPDEGPKLGVRVDAVHPAVADYLDLPAGLGLMVVEVVEPSLAQRLGVQAKDLLLEVGGRPIRSVEDVAAALSGGDESAVRVKVLRRGQERILEAR